MSATTWITRVAEQRIQRWNRSPWYWSSSSDTPVILPSPGRRFPVPDPTPAEGAWDVPTDVFIQRELERENAALRRSAVDQEARIRELEKARTDAVTGSKKVEQKLAAVQRENADLRRQLAELAAAISGLTGGLVERQRRRLG